MAAEEEFLVASDMTLYGNPLNRALAACHSERQKLTSDRDTRSTTMNMSDDSDGLNLTSDLSDIQREDFPSTSLAGDSADSGDIIAADMVRYDHPLNCLDRLAIRKTITTMPHYDRKHGGQESKRYSIPSLREISGTDKSSEENGPKMQKKIEKELKTDHTE